MKYTFCVEMFSLVFLAQFCLFGIYNTDTKNLNLVIYRLVISSSTAIYYLHFRLLVPSAASSTIVSSVAVTSVINDSISIANAASTSATTSTSTSVVAVSTVGTRNLIIFSIFCIYSLRRRGLALANM